MHLIVLVEVSLSVRVVFRRAGIQKDVLNILRSHPFSENENIHPAKERKKQQKLGNKLKEEVKAVSEVQTVQALHKDTERHLDDRKNNCQLHLKVVCVGK